MYYRNSTKRTVPHFLNVCPFYRIYRADSSLAMHGREIKERCNGTAAREDSEILNRNKNRLQFDPPPLLYLLCPPPSSFFCSVVTDRWLWSNDERSTDAACSWGNGCWSIFFWVRGHGRLAIDFRYSDGHFIRRPRTDGIVEIKKETPAQKLDLDLFTEFHPMRYQ